MYRVKDEVAAFCSERRPFTALSGRRLFRSGWLSYVTASMQSGTGFSGSNDLAQNQLRGMVETGFMF
ncbi:hypothetical protein [Acidithiobacillus ferrooxidans]|jgi:hypothetical protein|uniref:hypothetical protein n=1 Tax=Acidithiobacillus ferrooxidans TaxID=920 RepID=UPI0027E1998B|nr:hypothetical protein [Acidithiobacillus ferrooxidans]